VGVRTFRSVQEVSLVAAQSERDVQWHAVRRLNVALVRVGGVAHHAAPVLWRCLAAEAQAHAPHVTGALALAASQDVPRAHDTLSRVLLEITLPAPSAWLASPAQLAEQAVAEQMIAWAVAAHQDGRVRGVILVPRYAHTRIAARAWLTSLAEWGRTSTVVGVSWHLWPTDAQTRMTPATIAILRHGLSASALPWASDGWPADASAIQRAITAPIVPLVPINLGTATRDVLERVPGFGRDVATRILSQRTARQLGTWQDLLATGADVGEAAPWLCGETWRMRDLGTRRADG